VDNLRAACQSAFALRATADKPIRGMRKLACQPAREASEGWS
jgi:hypothetical protein